MALANEMGLVFQSQHPLDEQRVVIDSANPQTAGHLHELGLANDVLTHRDEITQVPSERAALEDCGAADRVDQQLDGLTAAGEGVPIAPGKRAALRSRRCRPSAPPGFARAGVRRGPSPRRDRGADRSN
jgi:hypothetical protein